MTHLTLMLCRYLVRCVLPVCGCMFMLGVAVDRWGYGVWVLTPYNFFRFNIFEVRHDTSHNPELA